MLSCQHLNQRQSLRSSPQQRKAQFRLPHPNSLSHCFYRYAVVALSRDTEPRQTFSQRDTILQFEKKKSQKLIRKERTKIPAKRVSAGFFPLREYSLRGSKDKMVALYLNAGGGLRPAHKQLGKPTVFQELQDVHYLRCSDHVL